MLLLALNQKEILVKLPLTENYFDDQNSNFGCSSSQRLLVLGVDDGCTFTPIEGCQLTPAERYCVFNPQFDFSIFKDSDFRASGQEINFLLPKISPKYPLNPVFAYPVAMNNGVLYFAMSGVYHNEKLRFWAGTISGDWFYLDLPFQIDYQAGGTHSAVSPLFGGNNENARYYIESLDTHEKSDIAKLYGDYEFYPNNR